MTRYALIKKTASCVVVACSLLFSGRLQGEENRPKSDRVPTSSASGDTWFIREDGGNRDQCTGRADAPYTEKGARQPCAFKHPHYLFTDDRYGDKEWILKGGDTVIIRGGPYRMGYKGPNQKDYWGNCPGSPYGCSMPPIPAGTAEHPTRFLGENHQTCNKKTQLFGGYALGAIVNLKGSTNIDLECLELTDHSQCTRLGGGHPAGDGCHTTYPLSDYAAVGIITDATTSSVVLKNLDIHGLTGDGISGPIGGEVIADHVRIAFNGAAGWDFDDGRGTKSSSNALVRASYLTVEWNGCNEEYPITHAKPAYSCFDQDSGGYGDGVGTPNTLLNFTCAHCMFRYNTQDGLDLLHVRGSLISIKDSVSYGNMGQQWKMGAMKSVVFRNNVTIHNCRRMSADMPGAPEGYNRYLTLFCRAAGDGIAFMVNDDGTYVFQNNSFAGYGATSYDIVCSGVCIRSNITFQNNLHIGYLDQVGGDRPGVFYLNGLSPHVFAARDHNIYFNMRTCPSGEAERCMDPQISNLPTWHGEESLDNLDFHLTSGSPARDVGASTSGAIGNSNETNHSSKERNYIGAFPFSK